MKLPRSKSALPPPDLASAPVLEAAAAEIKAADKVLGEPIIRIESYLSSLALHVPAWVKVKSWSTAHGEYWSREVGYAWVDGGWHIAVRETHGAEQRPGEEDVTTWSFNRAPRKSRLSAIEKLPELVHDLAKETQKTARRMKEKANEVAALAAVLAAEK